MEVYILDDRLRRIAVIDRFESMIWTERYADYGDFQLVINSTAESRGLLAIDTWISVTSSTRVMVIENVATKDDSEGRSVLTVTGRSIETILLSRGNMKSMFTGEPVPPLTITDTPGNIARRLFTGFCVNNEFFPEDNIPFFTAGTLYPADTIPEESTSYTIDFKNESVYESIKSVVDPFNLGFRLYKGPDTTKLYFNVYTGTDRTANQTGTPAVIFSPDLENLTSSSELVSKENYKNIAYVLAPKGNAVAYSDGANAATSGFNRKILIVEASDIDLEAGSELTAALIQRGQLELSKHKSLYALDGELPKSSKYKYEVHYYLGDLVEMRSESGLTNNMRVTEQIFVDDPEGERSYPTLAVDSLILPGTWLAWDYNEVWDAVSDNETWDTA